MNQLPNMECQKSQRLEEYRKTLPKLQLPERKVIGNADFVGSVGNFDIYQVSFIHSSHHNEIKEQAVYRPWTIL